MEYSAHTKPGMGDPYWYEWSVGQKYIIDMLNPDNEISFVELQADVSLGLDDVTVTYENGHTLFVQVKHTRANDTLTFGDLVSTDDNKKNDEHKISLLGELAQSWNIESRKYRKSKVCIFTNRVEGTKVTSTRKGKRFQRPALSVFLSLLEKKLKTATLFSDLKFDEYKEAWEEWKKQMSCIKTDTDKLRFLRCLEIKTNQSNLDEIEIDLLNQLQTVFRTNNTVAVGLLTKLDHALRNWTSSIRKHSRISVEDVYSALALEDNIPVYNHDLIPTEPFFKSRNILVDKLERELVYGDHKVVFLSGVPGSGKTNIVSKLCNKRDSCINIRYYAYEPINPAKEYVSMDVSQRVRKENFWNELFNQLRKLLSGNLKKYNVPVVNELMSLEEMRTRFFEIASNYASDGNKPFIIAIDGIDHAARAGILSETFLPTIPNPEYIPNNIKILISGQPKDSYRNYPRWLLEDNLQVKEVTISKLGFNDILSLVVQQFPHKNEIECIQITDVVSRYAEGNTLAAIFAVYEATKQSNVVSLENELRSRRLSGNIEEYYRVIWESTKNSFKSIPYIDYKLAGIFSYFNEPVTARKLNDIFCGENISLGMWKNILKSLKPLLQENDGKYTILHNDVRVFLSGIIKLDQEHITEIASNLVDYYFNCTDKSKAFYYDIFRLLKMAKREHEFANFYNTDFIIEAYVHGVETIELKQISNDILRFVITQDKIDWNNMRKLSIGFMTIDQIEKSKCEEEKSIYRDKARVLNVHPYECYVESQSTWTVKLIEKVLYQINELYDNQDTLRAVGLFKRWFSGLNAQQLWGFLKREWGGREEFLSQNFQNIANDFGKFSCISEDVTILKDIKNLAKDQRSFVACITNSFFNTALNTMSGEKLANALEKQEILYADTIVEGIKILLKDKRYEDLAVLEKVLHDRLVNNSFGLFLDVFMQIATNTVTNKDGKALLKLWDKLKYVELPSKISGNAIEYYSMFAIVAGYLRVDAERFNIAEEIISRYISNFSYKSHSYYGVFFW
ncbi:hypothetical protein lbkm_1095 [Lachnospiraceae bacterium KM106-2]|nr:hypothetical protein lbkm_1095 [Lachnospiraceae bacterium KM106-2]